MSTDTLVLYSTAHIARDEYNGWLHQLNAVMKPNSSGTYDARLSKDVRHVWISLLEGKLFDMYMAEFKDMPETLAQICQLIGGEPQSIIVLDANDAEGSQILAVQLAALCAEHYLCVVLQTVGHTLIPREEILELRDAGTGFDGVTWETVHPVRVSWNTRIMEEARQLEEAKKRAQQEGRLSDPEEWPYERPETQHKEHLEAS